MSIRDLCYKIDITEQGLHQMIRNKSMKIEVLERISKVLGCPMSFWFSEENTVNNQQQAQDSDISGKQITPTIIHQKIDLLTKDLNEMLKDILAKQPQ
jgi:plasmid maintenance system antidote protein VapI